MATIGRRAYAEMFGPTVGDRVRLADTELVIEVEHDHTLKAGGYGDEVKFGGGKTIRDGMGQGAGDQRPRRARSGRLRHHQRADRRPLGHRQGRHRHQALAHRVHRQGRQPRRDERRRHRDRPWHRDHRRRRFDRHGRRHRQPHPLHLPAADRRSTGLRRHHHDRRRHRPRHRHVGDHGHTGPRAHALDAAGGRWLRDEPRLPRQGQREPAGRAAPADRCWRDRLEAARRLGHDAERDRLLPHGGRGHGHAGVDPQRHVERERLRRGHHRRHQGPRAVRVPHRRCGWRPRARHPARGGRAELPAELDQSDDALHREHGRRAPRHADGVPPPRFGHRRGPGVRREPHPQGNDRRRGRAARPRRDQHDEQRQPGDGPRRRGHPAHLADRAQDEGAARLAGTAIRHATTTPASSATSPSTRSTRRGPTASRTRWARSKSASGPTWCCGSRPSSASSRA